MPRNSQTRLPGASFSVRGVQFASHSRAALSPYDMPIRSQGRVRSRGTVNRDPIRQRQAPNVHGVSFETGWKFDVFVSLSPMIRVVMLESR